MTPLLRTTAARRLPILLVAAACGCGQSYGDVSERAYEYAKALYSVANRQASDRLDGIAAKINADAESGGLSEREAGWLLAIVEQSRDGDWSEAAAAARTMMEDQVKR
ncbi:MAG: hypothetical protein AAF596_01180 [Planctomycetota bacterium]